MRGLSFKLQKKMATCYNLTFNRAVSVAIAVEDKGRCIKMLKRCGKDLELGLPRTHQSVKR
jgi:hypothetical protein